MDPELSALEAKWTSSNDEADLLAWLNARLAKGERIEDLDPEEGVLVLDARLDADELPFPDLELAAHAGLQAAREAMRQPSEDAGIGWAVGFEAWGDTAVRYVGTALARLIATRLTVLSGSDLPRDVLDAIEGWRDDPSASNVRAVARAVADLNTAWNEGELMPESDDLGDGEDEDDDEDDEREDPDDDAFENREEFERLLACFTGLDGFEQEPQLPLGEWEGALADSIPFERLQHVVGREVWTWALRPRRAEAEASEARTYSPKAKFAEGDAIKHPRFGVGVVRRATAKWCEADFDGQTRRLAHGL